VRFKKKKSTSEDPVQPQQHRNEMSCVSNFRVQQSLMCDTYRSFSSSLLLLEHLVTSLGHRKTV